MSTTCCAPQCSLLEDQPGLYPLLGEQHGTSADSWSGRARRLLEVSIHFAVPPVDDDPWIPASAVDECELNRLFGTDRLAAAEEVQWFVLMNRFKQQADLLRGELDPLRPDPELVETIERLLYQAQRIRNGLLHVFARLAVSVATHLAGESDQFDELISEANWTLILATDKFDASRGFRFSTYATHAIRRNLYRFRMNRYREDRRMTATDHTDSWVDQCRPPLGDQRQWTDVYDQLLRLVSHLDVREQSIIRARFGLDDQPPQTLRRLSHQFGISRERIRQLEQRAIHRLRHLAREVGFDPSVV